MRSFIHAVRQADGELFLKVHNMRSGWQNRCFSVITELGGTVFQIMLIVLLILLPPTRETGITFGIIQLLVTLIIQLLKLLVSRVRPYHVFAQVVPLRTEKDSSFPSGHTAAAFTSALTLHTLVPSLFLLCLAVAALVGYSRIYLGVHYPTDVIGGGVIGLGTTVLLLHVSTQI